MDYELSIRKHTAYLDIVQALAASTKRNPNQVRNRSPGLEDRGSRESVAMSRQGPTSQCRTGSSCNRNYGAVGTWPVTVFAHPQNGSPALGHFTFIRSVAPVEITVAEIATQESIEGDSVSLPVFASVSHDPAIDYSYVAVNLPPGLTIDSDTGLISGDLAYGTVGSWTVSLYAYPNNGSPSVGYHEFTWNVVSRYAIDMEFLTRSNIWRIESLSLETYGTAVDVSLELYFRMTDRDGQAVSLGGMTYLVTNLPDGVTLASTATGFMLTGIPTQAALAQGTHFIQILATDGVSSVHRDLFLVVAPVPLEQVVINFRAPQQGFPFNLDLGETLNEAAEIVRDMDKELILDEKSIRYLVALQMNPIFRDLQAGDPMFDGYRASLRTLLLHFPDDVRREFNRVLLSKDLIPAPILTPTVQQEVTQNIQDLLSDDPATRDAASAYLQSKGELIFLRLQNEQAASNDLDFRNRVGQILDNVLGDHDRVQRYKILEDLKGSTRNNEYFDAKARLRRITQGPPDALITIRAKELLQQFQ